MEPQAFKKKTKGMVATAEKLGLIICKSWNIFVLGINFSSFHLGVVYLYTSQVLQNNLHSAKMF